MLSLVTAQIMKMIQLAIFAFVIMIQLDIFFCLDNIILIVNIFQQVAYSVSNKT